MGEPAKKPPLRNVKYRTEETAFGVWRRYTYANGRLFAEFISHERVFGLPLLHYTRGRCPETGKTRTPSSP